MRAVLREHAFLVALLALVVVATSLGSVLIFRDADADHRRERYCSVVLHGYNVYKWDRSLCVDRHGDIISDWDHLREYHGGGR